MSERPLSPAEAQRANAFLASSAAPATRMRLLSFKPLVKNSLRGFAEFELPSGLRIIDCKVLVSHGRAWVSLPSKPVLDQAGQQKRDINGKPVYVPVVQWRDRDLSDRFSDVAIGLIQNAHPGALDGAP